VGHDSSAKVVIRVPREALESDLYVNKQGAVACRRSVDSIGSSALLAFEG